MITQEIEVLNKLGLHARPSAQLAKAANLYRASITLTHGKRSVDAKSILGLMTMALPYGTKLTLNVDGPDEADAAKHITDRCKSRFGESE